MHTYAEEKEKKNIHEKQVFYEDIHINSNFASNFAYLGAYTLKKP